MGPSIYLELTVDDLVAFNLHALKTSQSSRKQMRRAQRLYAVPLLIVAPILLLAEAVAPSTLLSIAPVIGAAWIGWILFCDSQR